VIVNNQYFEAHIENCAEKPVCCSCGGYYTESWKDEHLKGCPDTKISCPYSRCNFVCARKQMSIHMQEKGEEHINQLEQMMNNMTVLPTKESIRESVINSDLVCVIKELCSEANAKVTLLILLALLLILPLLPLRSVLVRLLISISIGSSGWTNIMQPTLTRAKLKQNSLAVFLYITLFALAMLFVWKWLALIA